MMRPVAWSRFLQFRAGPNEHRFYACEEHEDNLRRADVDLFFGVDTDPVEAVLDDDGEECYWCRGKDGP